MLLAPFLFTLILFLIVMKLEPRSLWSGFLFFCVLGGLALSALLILLAYSDSWRQNRWAGILLTILLMGVLFLFLLFPFALVIIFLVEGIRLIRREGFSLSNCLSIVFALLILFYLLLLPYIGDFFNSAVFTWCYGVLSVIIGYESIVLAMFTFSAWLNLIHLKKGPFDQIVVLGSGIFGTRVPPLLADRIARGIALQKNNPGSWLIVSGGQGPGEDIPEGAAMKAWAIEHGADQTHLLSEEQSKNTRENLLCSQQMFPVPHGKTAIVTSRYHVFRALLYARELGIPAVGYGAKTKLYFSLNAFLREFIAYLAATRRQQMRTLFWLLVPFWILLVLQVVSWIFQ